MKKSLLCGLWIGISGLVAMGCGGGGGGGGYSSAPVTSGSVGIVTSDLPTSDLNATGYDFASVAANTSAAGKAAALGAAPVGTATLVAWTSMNEAELLVSGTYGGAENVFPAAPSSIARLQSNTDMFLALRDRAVNGAGDIYRREDNGGIGTWSLALDTDTSEAYVAAVGTSVLALAGGPDQAGEVYQWDGTAQILTSIAALGSMTPTAAASHDGVIYVGGTDSAATGGPAKLVRLTSGAVEEIGLPIVLTQPGLNYRQEITAMLTVGNATQGETIFLAIGVYDLTSGAPLSGSLIATNGTEFEQLVDFAQDAPTCLAWHDSTVYAGTYAGRLVHREDSGSWLDESALPVIQQIASLLSLTADTLLIGTGSDTGPAILVRTEQAPAPGTTNPGANPNPNNPPMPAGKLSYASDVAPIMVTCASCHRSNGRVKGNMLLTSPTNVSADYQTVLGYVDLAAPANSQALLSAQGIGGHARIIGGAGDPNYDTLLLWVQDGALP